MPHRGLYGHGLAAAASREKLDRPSLRPCDSAGIAAGCPDMKSGDEALGRLHRPGRRHRGRAAHVHLVELREAPEGTRDWRVSVVEVEDAIRAAGTRWRVLEVAGDSYRWVRSLELLDRAGIPVGEYPRSPAGMGPAPAASPRRSWTGC
jgi:hypothetical protein